MARETIGDFGEFRFLSRLIPRLTRGAGVIVGPGQDCAVVRAGNERLLVTVDAVVEGVHFQPGWMSARQLGHSVAIAERHYLGVHRGIPKDAHTLEAAMQVESQLRELVHGPNQQTLVALSNGM